MAVVYRKLVGDGTVVLADEYRCVNGDGGAVPTVVCREVMQDGRAALAGGTRNPWGLEVGWVGMM